MHCNQIFSKQLARMVVMTMMSSAGWEFLQSTLWGILTADFFLCLRASFIRSIFSAPAQTCQEKKFCLFFDAAQESRCMVTAPWTPNKSHVQATYNFFSPNSVFFKGWPCSRCNWIPSLPFTFLRLMVAMMMMILISFSEMHCKQIFSNRCGIFLSEHEVEFQLRKAIKVSR